MIENRTVFEHKKKRMFGTFVILLPFTFMASISAMPTSTLQGAMWVWAAMHVAVFALSLVLLFFLSDKTTYYFHTKSPNIRHSEKQIYQIVEDTISHIWDGDVVDEFECQHVKINSNDVHLDVFIRFQSKEAYDGHQTLLADRLCNELHKILQLPLAPISFECEYRYSDGEKQNYKQKAIALLQEAKDCLYHAECDEWYDVECILDVFDEDITNEEN